MDDTLADRAPTKQRAYIPPPVNGDFYRITDLLDQKERAVVKRVRDFMGAAVAPIIDSKSGPAFDALIFRRTHGDALVNHGNRFPRCCVAPGSPPVLKSGPTSRCNMFESLETQSQISPERAHPEWRLRGGL